MKRSAKSRSARSASSRSGSSTPTAKPIPERSIPALYVHLPFCVVKCGYCDFNSFAGAPEDQVEAVLEAILAELRGYAPSLAPRTIFIGGGTPTQLRTGQLERVLDTIRSAVDLDGLTEWTVEANPESTTPEKLQLFAHTGVTRVSIGAQSFDASRLAFLDRPHDAARVATAAAATRDAGLPFSLDLIFGIPGQEPQSWLDDLDHALALGPGHLSCYCLTFEHGTRLWSDRARGRVTDCDESSARQMLLGTRERLQRAGLAPYEISNFARPGQECRHNLNYWRGGDYIGIGPGAASHLRGRRWTNTRALDSYCRRVRATGSGAATAESLAPSHRAREAVWLGLRLTEGADLAGIEALTGVDPWPLLREALAPHLAAGRVAAEAGRIWITPRGFPFSDGIAAAVL